MKEIKLGAPALISGSENSQATLSVQSMIRCRELLLAERATEEGSIKTAARLLAQLREEVDEENVEGIRVDATGSGEVTSTDIEVIAKSISEDMLTDNSNMEGYLTVNCAYEDSVEMIENRFPKVIVNNIEPAINISKWDAQFINAMDVKYPTWFIIIYGRKGTTKKNCEECTVMPSFLSDTKIVDVSCLINFPNMTSIPDRAFDACSNLEKVCFKWIKTFGTYLCRNTKVKRCVMPSFTSSSSNGTGTFDVLDMGPNASKVGRFSFDNCKVVILRRNGVVNNSGDVRAFGKMYVPYNVLESYKQNSSYNPQADKIFPIGGPTWVSEFGSSDPYADLTDEERSWYEDLFPDLYKDWVAPTED